MAPRRLYQAVGATPESARAQIGALGPGTPEGSSPLVGQVLTWDGSAYTPADVPTSLTDLVYVSSPADFPAPSGGVRTLEDATTYVLLRDVDLQGDRLVAGNGSTIVGEDSGNCILSSTGLTGTALLTSAWGVVLRFLSIEADVALDLNAFGNPFQVLDWIGVRFLNCPTIGTIRNYQNFSMLNGGCKDCGGLTFDGTMGGIGFTQVLLNVAPGTTLINLPATLIVTRFRITLAGFSVLPGETGINASLSATIPTDGYILQSIAFSGGGTYLAGIQSSDNRALFADNIGIANSGTIAQYSMTNNVTSTPIAVQSTFVKVLGTTTSGPYVQRFSLANNRATFVGSRTGFFKVSATLSFTSGSNQLIVSRIAVNGTTIPASEAQSTTGATGRSENLKLQAIVQLAATNYIEVWIMNDSATTAITVSELNVIVERVD